MNNVMLDLETMGQGTNAAIVAIGAVHFTIPEEVLGKFYYVVDLQSCLDEGLEVDGKTVIWWLQQSMAARAELCCENPTSLRSALASFRDWLPKDSLVWGNGPSFDNAILANAYRKVGMEVPWDFRKERCYRTIRKLAPEMDPEGVGVRHCAVDDAESQARYLIKLFKNGRTSPVQ